MSDGRVLFAPDDGPDVVSPTWVRLDDTDNLVSGYDTNRGRQTLSDLTDTGTATVYLNDRAGLFDPGNGDSPYFGKVNGKQILLQNWNPVTATWDSAYRGTIDRASFDINPATDQNGDLLIATIQLECVDIFEPLAAYGLTPGLDGKTPPAGSEGTICYYGGVDPLAAQDVDDRIIEVLTDVFGATWQAAMTIVFSGNTDLQPTNYDADESALVVLRDCAEAEMPQIANIYVDRHGRFVFHGRISRFDPDGVAAEHGVDWEFTRWPLGDGKAIAGDPTRGQMRVLSYASDDKNLINAVLCAPKGIPESLLQAQVFADATSITDYRKHAVSITDLIINEGTTLGNTAGTATPGLTSANDMCLKYAEFLVKNQKDPRITIDTLTVKAIDPLDHRAAATWGVLTKADISDIVNLKVGYPGGVGIGDPDGEDYYIESVTQRVRPLVGSAQANWHDYIEVDLGVSPAVWSMDTNGVFAV